MKVKYYKEIFEKLLQSGYTQQRLADEIKITRMHMRNILGLTKGRKPQSNLKDEQLSTLIRLCKKHQIEPNSWAKLGKMIDSEVD